MPGLGELLQSAKDISNLIDEWFVGKIDVFDLRQLFEEFSLIFGQHLWRDERDGDEKIAFSASAESRHTVWFDAKDSAGLRSRWYFKFFFAIERFFYLKVW